MRVLLAALLCHASLAPAQSSRVSSPWAGFIGTPAGALPPILVSGPDSSYRSAVAGRVASWQASGRDRGYDIGASYLRETESRSFALTAALFQPGCDCGAVTMLGADLITPKRDTRLFGRRASRIATRASVGVGRDSERYYLSGTVGLSLATQGRIGPFATTIFAVPEFGWASVLRMSIKVGGLAPIAGGGVSLKISPGRDLVLSASHVFVEGSLTNLGLALRWAL